MSGLVGGHISARSMADDTPIHGYRQEVGDNYQNDKFEIFAKHSPMDTQEYKKFHDNDIFVCVYGNISKELDSKFASNILAKPEITLREADGTFLVVGVNTTEENIIVGTDKLGARQCYFVPEEPVFSTSVSACLPIVDSTVDKQAIADFILMGHLWGTRTLVSEVKAMRPATIYRYKDQEWSSSRYWKPSYNESQPTKEYINELAERFQAAVESTAAGMPDNVGIWISGGLDSRSTATVLNNCINNITGYTYNANPPTGDNTKIANRIGNKINLPICEVPLSEENTPPSQIERLIDVCDGMIRWNTSINLSASYDVSEQVLLEGVEGSLMGDHLLQSHFTDYSQPIDSLIASEASQPVDVVKKWLDIEVDPTETLKNEVRITDESSLREQILDIHFQNYYNRLALASNSVMRDVGEDRVVYTNGDYLEWCSRLPTEYRKGTVPLTSSIPMGTSRAKLGLAKRVSSDTSWITYERTKLPPVFPYYAHVFGFFANVGINRLTGKATYGNGQLADSWLRSGGDIAKWTESMLRSAANRDIFSDDVIKLWEKHQNGENLSPIISQITTLEWWLSEYVH